MNLDRKLQYEILLYLQATYPQETDLRKIPFFDHDDFQPNVWYLSEHGLIEPKAKRDRVIGAYPRVLTAAMTAKGLDFLVDDGGLGAILNRVTVRFEVDNIQQIFQEIILASSLPEAQKTTLRQKMQSMSGDVLKGVMVDTMKEGLKNPTVWTTIVDLLARL